VAVANQRNNETTSIRRMMAVTMVSFTGLCVLHLVLRDPNPPLGDTVIRLLPCTEWGFGKRSDVPIPLALPPEVTQGTAKRCRILRIGVMTQTPPPQAVRPRSYTVVVNGRRVVHWYTPRWDRDAIPLFYNFTPRLRGGGGGRTLFRPVISVKPAQPSLATVFPVPASPVSRRFRIPVKSGESIPSSLATRLTRIGQGMRWGVIEVVRTQALKVEPVL
jgi:hypothetical protein